MSPSEKEFLRHIYEECSFVFKNTESKTEDEVLDDAALARAIVRNLEIIGEASKKISDDLRLEYPQIEWKKMSGTRDKLIHDYFGVDYDIVWDCSKQTSRSPFLFFRDVKRLKLLKHNF